MQVLSCPKSSIGGLQKRGLRERGDRSQEKSGALAYHDPDAPIGGVNNRERKENKDKGEKRVKVAGGVKEKIRRGEAEPGIGGENDVPPSRRGVKKVHKGEEGGKKGGEGGTGARSGRGGESKRAKKKRALLLNRRNSHTSARKEQQGGGGGVGKEKKEVCWTGSGSGRVETTR